ncbi:hypothetical protein [Agrobacterium tumefaciens]|uniref:hypothetical protein n=1 Tax=Agrobacterium tumefaciens TaxID=358 RepID=UPI00287E1500|nr:hypothetical protein [Agrobacterium tumefaciens]MDS7594306.1 hypothetical protein [Agrobacterium tumefaciens]
MGDALWIETIRDEHCGCAIAFLRPLVAQACKTTFRAKLITSYVGFCGFQDETTDFALHSNISSTGLPVEQCPEPRLRPLLLAKSLSHAKAAFSKGFDEMLCLLEKYAILASAWCCNSRDAYIILI